jgi:hypothetical protein
VSDEFIPSGANPYLYQCPVYSDFHDPLAVRRRLFLDSNEQFNVWLDEQRSADPGTAMRAHEKLLPVVRAAFNLPAVNAHGAGTGVADQQALDVLDAFLRWLDTAGKV